MPSRRVASLIMASYALNAVSDAFTPPQFTGIAHRVICLCSRCTLRQLQANLLGTQLQTVFIVEDDDLTRTSLVRRVAESQAGLQVTTAVGTCREIRAALEVSRPTVLLVDLGLPDGDGLDVIRETAQRWPAVLIMVITVFGDELKVVSSIKAGATGYLLKDDAAVGIGEAIRQMLAGGSPISPAIARHLIRHFRPAQSEAQAPPPVALTPREMEILTLA